MQEIKLYAVALALVATTLFGLGFSISRSANAMRRRLGRLFLFYSPLLLLVAILLLIERSPPFEADRWALLWLPLLLVLTTFVPNPPSIDETEKLFPPCRIILELLEDSEDAVVVSAGWEERRVVAFNKAMLDLFGYEAGELRGLSTRALYAVESDADRVTNRTVEGADALRGPLSLRLKRRDGHTFQANILFQAYREPKGTQLVGVIRPVGRITSDLADYPTPAI